MGSGRGSGGIETQVQKSPSTITSSHSGSAPQRSRKEASTAGRGGNNASEVCYRGDPRHRSGILLPSIRGHQEIGGSQTSHRSEEVELLSGSSKVQNGDSVLNQSSTPERGVCCISRHERCIFPFGCPHCIQKVYEILYKWPCVSVPSDVFRSGVRTTDIHQDTSPCCCFPSQRRNSDSHVPGRLADSSQVHRGSNGTHSESSRGGLQTGHCHQPKKVRFGTETTVYLPRSQIRPPDRQSIPDRGVSAQDKDLGEVSSSISEGDCPRLPIASRVVEPHKRSGNPGQVKPQASPILPEVFLEAQQRPIESSNNSGQSFLQGAGLVGRREQSSTRSAFTSTNSVSYDSDRRESCKVGGASGGTEGIGPLDPRRIGSTHKFVRNEGGYKHSPSFQRSIKEPDSTSNVRQHHGGVLHKETRGDTFSGTVPANQRTVQSSSEIRSVSESDIHPRSTQCYSGPAESQRSGVKGRMDSVQQSVPANQVDLSVSGSGPICHMPESSTPSIRESSTRRPGMGHGRPLHQLGGTVRLRLPTDDSNPTSIEEGGGIRLSDSSNSSQLAQPSLVPGPPQSISGVPISAANPQEVTPAASIQRIPHQARRVKVTRLAVIKERLLKEGFSAEVAEVASQPQRKSSLSVYQSHFNSFLDWCNQRGTALQSVTIPIIADYLYYLFAVLNREVSTIASHRTALSSALGEFDGFTVGEHPVLSNLISGFYLRRPPNRLRPPEWNLTEILSKLILPPFEPPRFDTVVQKKYTTWKTAFLLALACSKRASEIHAISRDPSDLRFDTKGVWLRCVPQFQAKTQRATTSHKSFFIPKLDTFSGRDTPDRLLCPVRMIKYYLKFTGGLSGDSRLFKKCKGEGCVLSKTISSWLKETIIFCSDDKDKRAKGHEVRKVSTSWAHATGAKVSDILECASWASTTTFTSFYLVDVQRQMDGRFRMAPVVPGRSSGPKPPNN